MCLLLVHIDGETNWNEALSDVNVVIHLAARVHVMRDDAVDPLSEFRRNNTAGTEHLTRAAGQNNLVSDGEDVTTPEILHRLGAAMWHPGALASLHLGFVEAGGTANREVRSA